MEFCHVVLSTFSWMTLIVGSEITLTLLRVFQMRHLLINLNRQLQKTKKKNMRFA
jgi:hypothetical protein